MKAENLDKKYYIISFGCQMNELDTEVISGLLENIGYIPASDYHEADLLLINTCAVRQKAEDKVAAFLGELRSWKKERKGRMLAVGGCMPQQKEIAQYLRRNFKHVDIIWGTHSVPHLPDLIDEAQETKKTVVDIEESYAKREGLPVTRKSNMQAWVPIIYGCTNYCSYCIVPYVRGKERSRSTENIVDEVKQIAEQGYKEITLLGQNVNAYGKDLNDGSKFTYLLEELDEIDGIERIRFMTSHPRDFEYKIIEVIANSRHICEHFHLPLQAGSNHILQKMNRGYTREHYFELIQKIKEMIPGASITTDLIVGFPGETEEDFEQTLDMVELVKFDAAYTFVYSKRKGTPAANMPEQISSEVKKERIERLIKLQQSIGWEINQQLVGQTVEVLVEGTSKNDPKKLTGRTRTNKLVHFTGDISWKGFLCPVTITDAQTWYLSGEIAKEEITYI